MTKMASSKYFKYYSFLISFSLFSDFSKLFPVVNFHRPSFFEVHVGEIIYFLKHMDMFYHVVLFKFILLHLSRGFNFVNHRYNQKTVFVLFIVFR